MYARVDSSNDTLRILAVTANHVLNSKGSSTVGTKTSEYYEEAARRLQKYC
jgi:hypothetical protein